MKHSKTLYRHIAAVLIMMLLFAILPLSALAAEAEDVLVELPAPVEWTDPNDPDNPYPYGLPVDTVFPAEIFEVNPYAVATMSQGGIPDEMWDNSILRALEYTGYDVQWLKDNNKLYNAQYIASSLKNNRPSVLSDIGYYNSCACPNGDETVTDSSTVTGKAPNIRYFERNGMVCASFVTYYLCNYLPNIEGVDTSALYEKAKELGADPGDEDVYYLTTVTLWKKVLDSLASQSGSGVTKYTNEKTAYQNLVPGDVIVFANDGKLVHIGIYAGEYDLYSNGSSWGIYHFLIHVGNSRGPEINTVEYMESSGSKASEPIAWYHLDFKTEVNGELEIIKTNSSGNVSGFQFRVQGNGIDQTVTSDSTGKIKVENLQEGTYTVTEMLPADSAYYCTSPNPQTVTVEAGKTSTVTFNNEKKQWCVTVSKKDRDTGGAQADATLDGAVYGLYKDGNLIKAYTVKNGTFTIDSYDCGTGYTLKEISTPPGYQLDTTVYNLNDYSSPEKCSGSLTTAQVTVLEDVITGHIEIIKRTLNPVSNETASESGAVFRYYLKSAGSYDTCPFDQKGTMTTGSDGKARSGELPYGTYIVEQVSGAEGTDLVDSFEVEVSENGKTYSYTKDNPYWTGTVSFVKVDGATAIPLVATFVLMDEDSTVLETVTTGDDGKASYTTKLVYGKTYYVQETLAPDGYALDETLHPITVTERDQEITLTLENIPEEGSISVRKMDTQGTSMAGVKFRLDYSTDGQNWKRVTQRDAGSPVTLGGCTSAGLSDGCLTTDSNGLIVFTGLRISGQNQKVYYRLIECSTKDSASMLVEPAYESELPMDGCKDITITAVNSQVFELPHTGSNSILFLQLGQILCTAAGALLLFRRKEE